MMNHTPSMDTWHRDVTRRSRGPALFGLIVIGTWVVGFGAWAMRAPIDGAVVSQGSFVATGQNKVVQHLEGGILREVLVREGEIVEAGQVVARLDETAAQAKLRRLTQRMIRLEALQARLGAEIAGRPAVDFPASLKAQLAQPEVRDILDRQRAEFEVRRLKLSGDIEVLRREHASLQESLGGLAAQLVAANAQTQLFQSELGDKQSLLEKNLVRRSDVMALKRAEARAVGDAAQVEARIADVKERMSRVQQQMSQIQTAALQRATEDLRSTETEMDDIREQIRASQDILDRVDIRAPVKGIVVRLNHQTRGGVMGAGGTLMELFPMDEELVIESRIMPGDVVHVRNDQPALIRLTSANQRLVPFIDGRVVYVSADAVAEADPRRVPVGSHGSFVVRVQITDPELKTKARDFQPMPGMPVELFIKTGERTFFQYIVKPITDSFTRAFREQ